MEGTGSLCHPQEVTSITLLPALDDHIPQKIHHETEFSSVCGRPVLGWGFEGGKGSSGLRSRGGVVSSVMDFFGNDFYRFAEVEGSVFESAKLCGSKRMDEYFIRGRCSCLFCLVRTVRRVTATAGREPTTDTEVHVRHCQIILSSGWCCIRPIIDVVILVVEDDNEHCY